MKKIFLLLSSAFFLMNCSDTKDVKEDPKKPEKVTDEKVVAKKADVEQKKDLKNLFDNTKPQDVTTDDKGGWPKERQDELRSICMDDVNDMPAKYAESYCNCQLGNVMKIFPTYAEAMKLFNKTEEDLSDDEMRKLEMVLTADDNCMEQMNEEEPDGKENDKNDD